MMSIRVKSPLSNACLCLKQMLSLLWNLAKNCAQHRVLDTDSYDEADLKHAISNVPLKVYGVCLLKKTAAANKSPSKLKVIIISLNSSSFIKKRHNFEIFSIFLRLVKRGNSNYKYYQVSLFLYHILCMLNVKKDKFTIIKRIVILIEYNQTIHKL